MARMKMNEFKTLVKECVRECIKEIMNEQISPTGFREMFQPQVTSMPPQGLINPMDAGAFEHRQEVIRQNNMMQNQLIRQTSQNKLHVQGVPSIQPENERAQALKYYGSGNGYTNPSDRLRLADQRPMMGYDPMLDADRNMARRQRQTENRVLRLDPDLDTPVGGGDIRPPDPNVLRGIYDDTMRTTLVQQVAAEREGPVADKFAAMAAQRSPDDFMGSDIWATLAFQK